MTLDEFIQIFDKYSNEGYSDIEAYEMAENDHFDLYKKSRYKDFSIFHALLAKYNYGRSLTTSFTAGGNPVREKKIKKIRPIKEKTVRPKTQMTWAEFMEVFNTFIGDNKGLHANRDAYEQAELKHAEIYGKRRFELYKSFRNSVHFAKADIKVNLAIKRRERYLKNRS